MRTRLCIFVIALALGLLPSGCVWTCIGRKGDPVVRGIRPETGEAIVSREVLHPLVWSFPFPREGSRGQLNCHYYLRKGRSETPLGFLREDGLAMHYGLPEIFPIRDTQLWAGFRITEMRRESVDLKMFLFDRRGIQREFEIKNAIRHLFTPRRGNAAYSTELGPETGKITITTATGCVVYDPRTDVITSEGG